MTEKKNSVVVVRCPVCRIYYDKKDAVTVIIGETETEACPYCGSTRINRNLNGVSYE